MQASVESKAREALKLLTELQEIDDELGDIAAEQGDLPEEVEKLARQVRDLEVFIESRRAELLEAEAEVNSRGHILAEATEKLTKYQQQLYAVKTTREYDAITAEFNYVKDEIASCEKVISQQTARRTELSRVVEERMVEFDQMRIEERQKQTELAAKQKETSGDVKILTEKRDQLVAKLHKPIYAHYERIRTAKDGRGVARVFEGACGGCFAVIPPQIQQNIRAQVDITLCETCGRYLVP